MSEFCLDFAGVGRAMAVDPAADLPLEEAFEAAFTGALEAANRMRATAPPAIAAAVEAMVSQLEAAVAVIERYGWNPTRASVEGSAAEQEALRALDQESEEQRLVVQFVADNCSGS